MTAASDTFVAFVDVLADALDDHEATSEDLAAAAATLSSEGALGGASDHGVSKSLYGADPDGNEFEIMWRVPRDAWGEHEEHGSILPLDIDAEVDRWGTKA